LYTEVIEYAAGNHLHISREHAQAKYTKAFVSKL